MIAKQRFYEIFPNTDKSLYDDLNNGIKELGIKNPLFFIANAAVESSGFTVTVENLNYSAEGLIKTFSKYFTHATAATYHRRPQAIANIVYANRLGNGNTASGDGWKYRGRGYIQVTGKANYASLNKCPYLSGLDFVQNPDILTQPKIAIIASLWWWKQNVDSKVSGYGEVALKKSRKLVNGGLNGWNDKETDCLPTYNKMMIV